MPCARPHEPQIGRGIAELAPALVAVDDFGAHDPGIAEELVRLGYSAGAQSCADQARAHQPSGILEARHDIDCEPEFGPLRGEIIG